MRRARIDEAFALTCPHCAGEMRIIALVTDPASIQAILAHMVNRRARRRGLRRAIRPPGPAISTPAKSRIPRASPPGAIRWPNPNRNPSSTRASRGQNTPCGADETGLPSAGAAPDSGAENAP